MSLVRPTPPVLLIFIVGCGSCPGGDDLRVGGEHPYVRCLERPAPEPDDDLPAGWRIQARALAVGSDTWVIGAGPAPGSWDTPAACAPDEVAIILGGLGADVAAARATVQGLSACFRASLVLPGGGDDEAVWTEVFEAGAPSNVVDGSGIAELRLEGSPPVALLPGGPARYAAGERGCGFSASDLERRAGEVGDDPELVIGWTAPRGSDEVDAFAREITAPSGVFAWPEGAVTVEHETANGPVYVVPRVTGPPTVADDGTWVSPELRRFRLTAAGAVPVPQSR